MLFPPILDSALPAFVGNELSFYVTLPSYMSVPTVASNQEFTIEAKVCKTSNNLSIFDTEDGIARDNLVNFSKVGDDYKIKIKLTNVDWAYGELYKVQVRFVIKQEDETYGYITVNQSEWSNIMIIKRLQKVPTTLILNSNQSYYLNQLFNNLFAIENSVMPLFKATCEFEKEDSEFIDKYQFKLLNSDGAVIEDSGLLSHNPENGTVDTHMFKTVLEPEDTENDGVYQISYQTISKNGYVSKPVFYEFKVVINYLSPDYIIKTEEGKTQEKIQLQLIDNDVYCQENGCVKIYLKHDEDYSLSGYFVLKRASEKTNYKIWEDIQYYSFLADKFLDPNGKLIYTDYTVESGIGYQYLIQELSPYKVGFQPIFGDTIVRLHFDYAYLVGDGGLQLKLKFNNKMASFKKTTLVQKQDSLGGKYPNIVRNANAYYAEFPINGLISWQMDSEDTFLTHEADGYYYKNDLIIPNDRYVFDYEKRICSTNGETLSTNPHRKVVTSDLTFDNRYLERLFREQVEKFLNNGQYKLYRSGTEGNMIVALTNINFVPNQQLGRMIWEFSATAYEIAEFNFSNLIKHNIIKQNTNFEEFFSEEDNKNIYFGQLSGLFFTKDWKESYYLREKYLGDIYSNNLLSYIKTDIEKPLDDQNSHFEYKKLKGFWIDSYPNIDFSDILSQKEKEYFDEFQKSDRDEEKIQQLEREINKYRIWRDNLILYSGFSKFKLLINGKPIILGKNQIYSLDDLSEIESFTIENIFPLENTDATKVGYRLLKDGKNITVYGNKIPSFAPLIINYICEVTPTIFFKNEDFAIAGSAKWYNQISGIFTENPTLIKMANHNSSLIDQHLIVDSFSSNSYNNININSAIYNVYKNLNILDVIYENFKTEVQKSFLQQGYSITNLVEEEKGVYNFVAKKDEDKIYTIKSYIASINTLEIETIPGTKILVNDAEITVGDTGKYRFVLKQYDNIGENPQPTINNLQFIDTALGIVTYTATLVYEGEEMINTGKEEVQNV